MEIYKLNKDNLKQALTNPMINLYLYNKEDTSMNGKTVSKLLPKNELKDLMKTNKIYIIKGSILNQDSAQKVINNYINQFS